MNFLLKLGFRNIGRNKVRSFLTIAAVVLCAGGLTLYSVLFSGIMDMFLGAMVNQTGHIRIIHTKFAKNERLGKGVYFVDNIKELRKQLLPIEGVKAVVPRIDLGAFVEHKGNQTPAMGFGIVPAYEKGSWDILEKIKEGRMIKETGKEILIGYKLAEKLHAKVGDSIVLIGKTVDDSMSALKLKVVGLLATGFAQYDKMFYMSLGNAQYFLDVPGKAAALLVFTNAMWKETNVLNRIRKIKLPKELTVQSWKETPMAAMSLPSMNIMLYVLGGIVVLIGGIGLLNTMMMSVLERKKEIGLLMALGLSPRKVAAMFLAEGFVFGLIGAVLGVVLASIASIPLIVNGISFGTQAIEKIPFPMTETIKGSLTIEGILIGLFVGVLTTVFGTLWPAYQASKTNPVEALQR